MPRRILIIREEGDFSQLDFYSRSIFRTLVPLLEVENVSKRFGALIAVRQVSLSIEKGEILGLIGPNGAGKTTLFNIIAGKYRPDSGSITFDGTRIDGRRPYEICHLGISRTYQLVKPFLTETVLENVLLGTIFGGRTETEDISASAERAISMVGLQESARKYVSTLPFIDRRRIELARAVATGAKLVLLDEPMAGLNPSEVQQFTDIVRKINESGITVLIIEHVMRAIMGLSMRIVVLDHGEKIAEGKPEQIAEDNRVVRVYLGE
jgi:branched-chain amino acid transport system ATP-binding protein